MPDHRRQAVLIDGCRTPFCRAFTEFAETSPVDLSIQATSELLCRNDLDPARIGEVIFGNVVPVPGVPNVAREIVLGLDLPRSIPGFTLNRACASSLQSITLAAEGVLAGSYDFALAGGVETLSMVPIHYQRKAVRWLYKLSRARSLPQRLKLFAGFPLRSFLPVPPDLTEPSTGRTMGQHAEEMAQKNGITREDQDDLAFQSHAKARAATRDGRLPAEIAPVRLGRDRATVVREDNQIRAEPDREKLRSLRPVFDRKYGTITAGNASPLTDGAAVVLIAEEQQARALGLPIKARITSWAYAGLDPEDQLLLGPAFSTPAALDRAGLELSQMDVVEMHEAFASQVLSNIKYFECDRFARERLGRERAIGPIPPERFNRCGGSIAIGHPFGATGARICTTLANELNRTGGHYGLATACAAGALGGTVILENPEANGR